MKKLSELKDFHGIDKSNEISLFEYGLLCQEKEETKEIQCWYGIEFNGDENAFITFAHSVLGIEEIKQLVNEHWFDKKAFFSYVGLIEEQWVNHVPSHHQIYDLISYYGTETIFGCPSCIIEIEND